MNACIERVASALYYVDDGANSWEEECEILKDEFRNLAKEAIALLEVNFDQEQREAA